MGSTCARIKTKNMQKNSLVYRSTDLIDRSSSNLRTVDGDRRSQVCLIIFLSLNGRLSTGQSKTKHKRSFLGVSTSKSSYGVNIVQELRDRYNPSIYHLEIRASYHGYPLDEYPFLGSQNHV